ncbi:MAG TPA: PfkB family carbohydrate kinase [Candidatus Limnocylindrales bacterium]|jgi:1-phosphofructokinase family hexose kinase
MTDGRSSRGRLIFVAANPSVDRLYELDRLTVGDIQRPVAVLAVAGGKGLNAARAAATLGGAVTAVGIVGGLSGDWIAGEFVRLGIAARWARAAAETRTCMSILDRSSGAMTEIYERGAAIDPAVWPALESIVQAELGRGDVAAIAFSGSLPPGAPDDGYARIARLASAARDGSVPILADTYGSPLAALLAEHPAAIKVNAVEAGEASMLRITDIASAAEAVAFLRSAGAETVVITLGETGALAAGPDGLAHLIPPDVRGPYPVGSGDAFLGAFAVGRGRGETVVEAARFGLAAGIANAEVPGAGNLDPARVAELLGRVEIRPI